MWSRRRPNLTLDAGMQAEKLEESAFQTVSTLFEQALATLEEQVAKTDSFRMTGEAEENTDTEIQNSLQERYKRGRFAIKREFAFMLAQERRRWSTARQCAHENYKMWQGKIKPTLLECLDDFMPIEIMDVYAYMRLARLGPSRPNLWHATGLNTGA
jgi:hypothetical protein